MADEKRIPHTSGAAGVRPPMVAAGTITVNKKTPTGPMIHKPRIVCQIIAALRDLYSLMPVMMLTREIPAKTHHVRSFEI